MTLTWINWLDLNFENGTMWIQTNYAISKHI